jgi:hypothetical protein
MRDKSAFRSDITQELAAGMRIWRDLSCCVYRITQTTLRIASDTTLIYYYFLKHYMFRPSRSSSAVYLCKNLKTRGKKCKFLRL